MADPGRFNYANVPATLRTKVVPLDSVRLAGADAPTLSAGSFAAPGKKITSATANNNGKTGDILFSITVPKTAAQINAPYTALGESASTFDITMRVRARLVGTPTGDKKLSASAVRSDKEGGFDSGIGTAGQLNETGEQTLTTSWANYTFTFDGADLSPGQELEVGLRIALVDVGGPGGYAEIGSIEWDSWER